MVLSDLYSLCRTILESFDNFANAIIDVVFFEISFGGQDIVLIELLFGTFLTLYLVGKILKAIIF